MIDRRKLIGMGLGAGASLAAPTLALAAARHGASKGHGHPEGRHASGARAGSPGHGLQSTALQASATPAKEPRWIAVHNLHTEEKLEAVYFENGSYVPDALEAVNKVLRDFRTGDVHPIEPRLLDILVDLQRTTGTKSAFQVISGYRSPQTNAILREQSAEVARHSLHMDGRAIDLYLEDIALYRLHDAALDLSRGGVGYYPNSKFVHLDVGPVRHWMGT